LEYDPLSDKDQAAGDGLIDLPLGPQAPGKSKAPPSKPSGQSPGGGSRGGVGGPATTPRHQQPKRPAAARRSRRKVWPWFLLLLLVAGGAAYWFFFRPPVPELSVGRLDFAPTRVGRAGEQARLELFNRGRLALEVSQVEIAGPAGGDFALAEDGCTGASLGPDAGCAVVVAFKPEGAGERGAVLRLASNASGDPLELPLLGSGLAPSIQAERSSLDFGRVAVGKAGEALALALSNSGTAPLVIARLAVEGSGQASFVWVSNGCSGVTLEAGASCSLRLAFRPRETGTFNAELRVWSDAPEDPRVALSGLGVAPGLFIAPSAVDFGDLRPGQRSAERSVRLENTGNAPLEIERVELVGANARSFAVTANDCDGQSLAAEQSCSVGVRYQPGEPARHEAALRVRAPALKQVREVALAGAALAPRIAVSATAVDFGQVVEYGTNESTLTISNSGSAALELTAVDVVGGNGAFGIAGRGCPPELAPSKACELRLRFSPSRAGGVDGLLRVRHNAPGSPSEIRLLGTGMALPRGAIAVEPPALDFGSLPAGERSEILTLRVKSVGDARLDLGGYALAGRDAADFYLVPASCEGLKSLLPGSDCTIGVRFHPQRSGGSRATVTIRFAGGTREVTLTGEGF
jgi:hypothetical protein